ncbi:unnamed protein product [Darwinula stevensoni]|uniref:C-type lectin domain-containing protein n=1 Tax=Darwinula stevensoni TaxID=69355 RepID=A0A7R9FTJ8_9CRUS|nr:unnamed protein product [Darwinula stevensoni]CAG0904848.1 unnamed protein product [Darwinula stevensoni]
MNLLGAFLLLLPLFVFVEAVSQPGYTLESTTCKAHYLKLHNGAESFEEARKRCMEDGGDLVTDNRGREWHYAIASYLKKKIKEPFFGVLIGAYRKGNNFVWVDGEEIS